MKYNIIYADPAWNFNFRNRVGLSDNAKSKLYDTMSGDDIKSLPVSELSADDCILFLWVMNSELPLALEVITSWRFKYKTVAFTWVKTTKNTYHFGGGNWTRSNPELCLLATKGKISRKSASVRNLVISHLREHSRKPDEIRNMIVELVGDLPRIELFARQKTEGWDIWGNELKNDVELNKMQNRKYCIKCNGRVIEYTDENGLCDICADTDTEYSNLRNTQVEKPQQEEVQARTDINEVAKRMQPAKEHSHSSVAQQLQKIDNKLYLLNSNISAQTYILNKRMTIQEQKLLNKVLSEVIKEIREIKSEVEKCQ